MANSRSALKRVRQTNKRSEANRAVKSRMRTARRRVLEAVESGDKAAAQEAYKTFSSLADKAGRANVIHRNAADRIKGRAAAKIATLS